MEQLVYLEDVEETQPVFLKKAVTKKGLDNFFSEAVKRIKL